MNTYCERALHKGRSWPKKMMRIGRRLESDEQSGDLTKGARGAKRPPAVSAAFVALGWYTAGVLEISCMRKIGRSLGPRTPGSLDTPRRSIAVTLLLLGC